MTRQAHPGEGGFTLFEVLAGLAISSLVMTALGAAMTTINRGSAQASASIARQAAISSGLAVLAGDFQRIERAVDDPAQPTRFLFSGRPGGMDYVLDERRGEGLHLIRLEVRAGAGGTELVRSRAPIGGAVAFGEDVVLLAGDFTLAFSYRAPRARLRDWSSGWQAADRMPDQIRLEITDRATGRLRIPVFVAALRISAEAACAAADAAGCTISGGGAIKAGPPK